MTLNTNFIPNKMVHFPTHDLFIVKTINYRYDQVSFDDFLKTNILQKILKSYIIKTHYLILFK
jgi:formate-dependent nitrite reductase cytochrome c552 subunit